MSENKPGVNAPLTDAEKHELLREWAMLKRESERLYEVWGDLNRRIDIVEKRLIENAGKTDEVAG